VKFKICILPGDGIGPEIIAQAEKVITRIVEKFSHQAELIHALIGGCAIDEVGEPLPEDTIKKCKESDAVLLGAVGGPKWDRVDHNIRPEKGLLGIRKELGLYANLRPAKVYDKLKGASCLREDIVSRGIDLIVVRELTGGIYFGEPKGIETRDGERIGYNTMIYSESEVRRIARLAFEIARGRQKKVCSVDKANVLDVSRLWREVVEDEAKNYPDVDLSHMYVDNAAMQLVLNPSQFDVIVTSNLFGDILSDEASIITGSIGMLPSASIGGEGPGLYEPIHGSAPDIAGQDKANPLATILSVAMMFRYSFSLDDEARAIEDAVSEALRQGYRTSDIYTQGDKLLSCSEMGDLIVSLI
jgi:3-isopropylmalate dehydrogenase